MSNSGADSVDQQQASDASGLSRRSVLRAGTAAAWSVPVVTVMAASPAYAVGSGPAALVFTAGPSASRVLRTVTVTSTLANQGGQTTVNLQVTVVLSGTGYGNTTSVSPVGWSLSSSTRNSADQATFLYTSLAQVAAGATRAFDPVFTLPLSASTGSGTASATTTGGSSAVATFSIS